MSDPSPLTISELVAPPTILGFTGENAFLSNFMVTPVYWRGRWWRSAEHAFQAAKATTPEMERFVAEQASPARAKRAGRKVPARPDWDQVRERVMLSVVRAKFMDPVLAEKLLATRQSILVELNDWGDRFWGMVQERNHLDGLNRLGVILEFVREEIEAWPARVADCWTTSKGAGAGTIVGPHSTISVSKKPEESTWHIDTVVTRPGSERVWGDGFGFRAEVRPVSSNLSTMLDIHMHQGRRLEKGKMVVPEFPSRGTTVVKVDQPHDVRVDRIGEYGNPYPITGQRNRWEAVLAFVEMWPRVKGWEEKTLKLAGKRLACHCAPLPCHGDYLAMMADRLTVAQGT